MDISRRALVAGAGLAALSLAGCGSGDKEEKPAAGGSSAPEPEKKEPEAPEADGRHATHPEPDGPAPYIKESVWRSEPNATDDGYYVHFDAMLGCTDTENCYTMMHLAVSAKSAGGGVLASCDQVVMFIAPDDVMPVTVQLDTAEEPATVEATLSHEAGQKPGNPYTLADLPVSGQAETETGGYAKWAGEFENRTGVSFDSGCDAYAVLRDGGDLCAVYVQMGSAPVADGATSPFEVTEYADAVPEHDSAEVYIVPNLI